MTREFIQLSRFAQQWKNLGRDDEDLRELEESLCLRPDRGDVVIGTGGLRKMRLGMSGSGKRGGMRILYVDFPTYEKLYLLGAYKKAAKVDLSKKEAAEIRKLISTLKGELKERSG